MSRTAPEIILSKKELSTLESWIRSGKQEHRLVFRAKIILRAQLGQQNKKIAKDLNTNVLTVGKWRRRFAQDRLAGLKDSDRPGKPKIYGDDIDFRVLRMLDQPVPEGFSVWSGSLIAEKLGDVSDHKVWRILREYNISLSQRHSWCISTDPEFEEKSVSIIGLYLDPPEKAIVISVDEKPAIQALERDQGYLKLPNGKAITGYSHEYKRHGTTTLFAALEVHTGNVITEHYNRRRRREFLDFMNSVIKDYPDQEIHVILDNLRTHKPKHERWLLRHKNVHFHFTPTHASWMNQVEIWFGILWKKSLRGASFVDIRQLRKHIDKFVKAYNEKAMPFAWKAKKVYPCKPKYKYADLCK
jgi:transposase